jgi:hypothetical protein
VLLRLVDADQAVSFYSREAFLPGMRPLLQIVRARKCA